jgi:hypothetical protein
VEKLGGASVSRPILDRKARWILIGTSARFATGEIRGERIKQKTVAPVVHLGKVGIRANMLGRSELTGVQVLEISVECFAGI